MEMMQMKQGTNAAIMRKRNEKTILSLINLRPISRAEIAKITGLTRAAVTIIIDELISQGYILEEQTKQATVGRQPILLSFNGASIYSVGINIRRTCFCVGIVDLNGKVILEESFPIVPPANFFACIKDIVDTMIQKAATRRRLLSFPTCEHYNTQTNVIQYDATDGCEDERQKQRDFRKEAVGYSAAHFISRNNFFRFPLFRTLFLFL